MWQFAHKYRIIHAKRILQVGTLPVNSVLHIDTLHEIGVLHTDTARENSCFFLQIGTAVHNTCKWRFTD